MSDSPIEMTQRVDNQVIRLEDRTDLSDDEKQRLLAARNTDSSTDES